MPAKTIHSCDCDGKKLLPLYCILVPVTGGPGSFRGLLVSSVACSTPPVLQSPPAWDTGWGHTTVTEPHVQRKLVSFVPSCWMGLLYF